MSTKTLTSSPRWILALIVTVFTLRALLAIAIVPPWQNPDEPQHFAWVHSVAHPAEPGSPEQIDLGLERGILRSMSAHGWWRHYDEPEPTPFPEDFSEIPEHIFRLENPPRIYYFLGAAGLVLASPDSLVAEYYLLRWMALALAVATVLCIWAGARRLFGVQVAAGATLLTALHPQFVLMSTAVNPDVLVYFCGAVVWWQGARLLTGDSVVASMGPMLCASVVGFFAKRSGASLILMLLVVPVLAGRFGRLGTLRVTRRFASGLVGGVALVGLGTIFWVGQEVSWLTEYGAYLTSLRMGPFLNSESSGLEWWTFFQRFSVGLFDSSWLVAGWLSYPAPASWLLIVRLLTAGAVAGCLIGALRPGMVQWRVGLALAGVLVLIQVAAVYGGLYARGFDGQGRFLFSVIGPFMVLFWVGIHSWWPRRAWPVVSAGLLSVMFALDIAGWLGVLVPAYAR